MRFHTTSEFNRRLSMPVFAEFLVLVRTPLRLKAGRALGE
jgi:hypothetical protein